MLMKKKLVLPEYDFSIDPEDAASKQRLSYLELLDHFKSSISKESLKLSIKTMEDERESLNKAIKHSLSIIREQSLLAAFLMWLKSNHFKYGYPDYAKMLIEKDILPVKDEAGNLLIIKKLPEKFPTDILESIRCIMELNIWEREMLVLQFLDFASWMKGIAGLSTFHIKDHDTEIATRRALKYDDFINFLINLDNKFQVIAKLLYFGDNITLEQVISLNIQDIDFELSEINYGDVKVLYSLHVFIDLRGLIGKKTSGRVFVGRQNSPLNQATVFRNFKEAALKSGLDPSFSPKILIIRTN